MKKLSISLILFLFANSVFALTLDEIRQPRPFMGKISNSDNVDSGASIQNQDVKPSKKAQIKDKTEPTPEEKTEIVPETTAKQSTNYADLSLKKLADDVSYELDLDAAKTSADLNVLWSAATERSETMKYTIYKLSNPDEDKPNDSAIKKILKPIASFATVAGASVSSDPFMATGALIGGGLVNAFTQDDKELNYKFSKVSDADMVLLVRKIDDLQKKLLDLYTDYKTKEKLMLMTKENFEKREKIYKSAQNKSKEELVIADVYYRNAKTQAQRAADEFAVSRAILENLVGTDALSKIED